MKVTDRVLMSIMIGALTIIIVFDKQAGIATAVVVAASCGMSWVIVKYLDRPPAAKSQRLFLVAIFISHDPDSWFCADEIAEKLGLTIREVRETLAFLQHKGHVTVSLRPCDDGRAAIRLYRWKGPLPPQ